MDAKNKTHTAPNEPIFVPEEDRVVEEDHIFIPSSNKQDLLEQRVNAIRPIISLKK